MSRRVAQQPWPTTPRPVMLKAAPTPVLRFDKADHEYFINDVKVPHITGMLEATGWIDDTWWTEESCERGTMVHRLAADYDLGAIPDPRSVECIYKGWFLAYVALMRVVRPQWKDIETALFDLVRRWGGRPDRVGKLWGAWAVVDLKTGQPSPATPIQLALQAILAAPEVGLPPTAMLRYEVRLRATGKGTLIEHRDPNDFQKAYEVIGKCCTHG